MKHPDCHNERCDAGWVQVTAGYAERLHPDPDTWPEDPAAAAAVREELERRRAEAARDVYPCKTCRATLFFRWAEGHHKPGHEQEGCGECEELRRGRRRTKTRTLAEPPPPPEETRRDLL